MSELVARIRSFFVVTPRELALNTHLPALDGVRGFAVLLVLMYDCLKIAPNGDPFTLLVRQSASAGWIGVDLFFVLSGFLITGILLDTKGVAGYWTSFIARRSVRIFPLYYATLVSVFFLIPGALWVFGANAQTMEPFQQVRENQPWYWLYLQNCLFAWQQSWPDDGLLKHFWSLAVEEQFYLVWPLVVAFVSRRSLVWLCFSLSLIALMLRFHLIHAGHPGMVGFVLTITRMDSLCWGALLAICLRSSLFKDAVVRRGPTLFFAGFAVLALGDLVFGICRSESYAAYTIGHTVIAIAFTAIIAGVVAVPRTHLLSQIASVKILTVLGKYSYAIYIFHRFIYYGVTSFNWEPVPAAIRGWAIFLTTLLCCLLAARISWIVLEQPCLGLKKYFPRPDEKPVAKPSSDSTSLVASAPSGGLHGDAETFVSPQIHASPAELVPASPLKN
jgi:peptidoglycan/LPS O-acetylase OafA/YrhL